MKLLIVSLDAYSLFDTSTHFYFGGAELRASLFAKELSHLPDVEVTVVTRDQAKENKKFDNVFVVPHPRKKGQGYWEKQQKLSTRIKNRLSGFSKEKKEEQTNNFFFESLKPTHVFILGMSPEAVECLHYCKKAGIPFIFGCASDLDLSEKYLEKNAPLDTSGNDASEYADVIRNAALVLVQSKQQEEILEKRFGRKGILIPNPISFETPKGISPEITECDVLWIGRTSALKRPELFFELARMLPQLCFRMILNNTDKEKWNNFFSGKSGNMEVIESVKADLIEYYFMKTKLFVNTSLQEGFPNTFLQAGKYGVPIIAMNVDPDYLLTEKRGGLLAGDNLSAVKESVLRLLNDQKEYNEHSGNIKVYVRHNHEISQVVKQLCDAMKQIN